MERQKSTTSNMQRQASTTSRPKYSRKTSRPAIPQDKRFVKQVMFSQYAPPHWVAMDIQDNDCLLVELEPDKKLEVKMKESKLEVLAVYSVQNPFLWGQFLLRSDQMKQQVEKTAITATEMQYFHPANIQYIETIARHGFDPRFDQILFNQVPQAGVAFYGSPGAAHSSQATSSRGGASSSSSREVSNSSSSVQYMFQAKVMVGSMVRRPGAVASNYPINHKTDLPVDTFTDQTHTVFRKYKVSETYPEYLVVYREAENPRPVLEERLPVKFVKVLYLPGKSYSRSNSRKPTLSEKDSLRNQQDEITTVQEEKEEIVEEKRVEKETIQHIVEVASVVIHREQDVDK